MFIRTDYTYHEFNDLDKMAGATVAGTQTIFKMEDQLGQTVTIEYRTNTETVPAYWINAVIAPENGEQKNIYHNYMEYEEFEETYPNNPTKDELFHIASRIYINAVKEGKFSNIFHHYEEKRSVKSHFCGAISDEIAALFEEIN